MFLKTKGDKVVIMLKPGAQHTVNSPQTEAAGIAVRFSRSGEPGTLLGRPWVTRISWATLKMWVWGFDC